MTRSRPIGWFVHHQGRGHAERCAAVARALPPDRPLTVFCARSDILPSLPGHVQIVPIPSLFEAPDGVPTELQELPTPATLHCAPVGWPTIREAIATICGWFQRADPALFVCDVSAELAQLCRIASVPHVKVLQHGRRDDAGHRAAYDGAVGLLAPWARALEQPERPVSLRAMTHYAPGLGLGPTRKIAREAARHLLGQAPQRPLVVVIAGGGGSGTPLAPLAVGARFTPERTWAVLGPVAAEWHETVPGNLHLLGWRDDVERWIAAADVMISSTGNTTCHMIAREGRPWLAVPEWRYFDEQLEKGRALQRVGAAALRETWPSSATAWAEALEDAEAVDIPTQRRLVHPDAARDTAAWLDALAERIWTGAGAPAAVLPQHAAE